MARKSKPNLRSFWNLGQVSFVGRQYKIEVDGDEYSIDLLFYNLKLRCCVVIELKVDKFKPEFAGKPNFSVSAVDAQG